MIQIDRFPWLFSSSGSSSGDLIIKQREEGGGQSQPEELRGGQTTRRDSGEVPEKEPQSRLRQRRERPRRKLRRGPEVGWD